MSDNVKNPSHYTHGNIECIEAIKSAISGISDPFEAYCTGNIIKYAWRWYDKNGVEDLEKAKQYADFIGEYRASKATPNPAQSKYADISDENLAEKCCVLDKWCDARWDGKRKSKCPFFAGTCMKYRVDLGTRRAEMIAYLESEAI